MTTPYAFIESSRGFVVCGEHRGVRYKILRYPDGWFKTNRFRVECSYCGNSYGHETIDDARECAERGIDLRLKRELRAKNWTADRIKALRGECQQSVDEFATILGIRPAQLKEFERCDCRMVKPSGVLDKLDILSRCAKKS